MGLVAIRGDWHFVGNDTQKPYLRHSTESFYRTQSFVAQGSARLNDQQDGIAVQSQHSRVGKKSCWWRIEDKHIVSVSQLRYRFPQAGTLQQFR